MDTPESITESIGDVIHKKKVAKKKQIVNSLLANSQMANCSSTVNPSSKELNDVELATANNQIANSQTAQIATDKNQRQRRNAEIDSYLASLLTEGLIRYEYKKWTAHCLHTLGLQEVNKIVIDVRTADAKYHKGKLLSAKLKGAMQLHYKRIYELESIDEL